MSILSGYSKVKDRILTSSGYKLLSRWTSSNTVDFDDGKTAQTKLGAINGIVKDASSLSTVTDPTFAAGAVAVKDALADVNSKLGKMFEFGGSAQKLRVEVDFGNNNQTAFQVYAGGTTFFRVEFMTTGIIYKVSTDSGKNWTTMLSK